VAAVALVSRSRPGAEDAVQEALARAWERTDRGERIESLRAWVVTVALNVVRSGFRRRRAERRATSRFTGASSGPAATGDRVDIARALAALPRRQREATVLRHYLDLDVGEIATILHVEQGTVKTTLFRARRALSKSLGERADAKEANDLAGS